MTDPVVSTDDLRLIAALQRRPRASWTSLGHILGSSPVTLARRWARLSESGLAWVTASPGLQTGTGALGLGVALVEVRVPPDQVIPAARELAQLPEVATIDLTAGGRELLLTVFAGSQDALAGLLLDRLHTMATVLSVHTHPVTRTFAEGSAWRMPGLSDVEQNRLAEPALRAPRGGGTPLAELVARELARDGRVTPTELGERLDLRPRRARELVAEVVAAGRLRFRVEVARPFSGFPVCTWYFLRTPAAQRDRVAERLVTLAETRAVVAVVGRYSLAVDVWTRTLDDVQRLEAVVEDRLPGVQIDDRAVVLRTTKIMGRLLDDNGRAGGFVPLPTYLSGFAEPA